MSESFFKDFRRFFLRGLTVVLPVLATMAIIIWFFTMIQDHVGKYTNVLAQWFVVQFRAIYGGTMGTGQGGEVEMTFWEILRGSNGQWTAVKTIWVEYHLSWIGLILAFVAIYILGRFVASYVGRGIWRLIQATFVRMPVVNQIFPHIKQVTDFLLSERKMDLSRVVAVEYPRKGVWSVGLVTGPGMRTLQESNRGAYLTVFIPSSPTPVTGYTITVRRDEVIDLPVDIDEALRFTISGGVIMPTSQQLSDMEIHKARHGALPQKSQPALGKEPQSECSSEGSAH